MKKVTYYSEIFANGQYPDLQRTWNHAQNLYDAGKVFVIEISYYEKEKPSNPLWRFGSFRN